MQEVRAAVPGGGGVAAMGAGRGYLLVGVLYCPILNCTELYCTLLYFILILLYCTVL